jgi:hypothetical protein
MKAFTRIEARILPEKNGLKNVITELVVGMTYTDDDSGLSVYRDTLVSLPAPDAESFIAFEDIDEAWCSVICERTATDNDWAAGMEKELEAAKSRPISKLFKFQEPETVEA